MTLYRQMFTHANDPTLYDSCDKRHMPLDAALAEADACSGYALRYYVEPVPGTEPRYALRVSGPNGLGSTESWLDGPDGGYTWAEVRAAWYRAAELNAGYHNTAWPLTYRVVAA